MKKTHLEPAKSVIAKFGVDKVATVTGKSVSRVYRWMAPKKRGGTDGYIPQADAEALLKYARDNEIALTANDFFASEVA